MILIRWPSHANLLLSPPAVNSSEEGRPWQFLRNGNISKLCGIVVASFAIIVMTTKFFHCLGGEIFDSVVLLKWLVQVLKSTTVIMQPPETRASNFYITIILPQWFSRSYIKVRDVIVSWVIFAIKTKILYHSIPLLVWSKAAGHHTDTLRLDCAQPQVKSPSASRRKDNPNFVS